MPHITFHEMIRQTAEYLERNRTCTKHHVEHTGSNAYLLDMYDYLGEIETGKTLIWYLFGLIVTSPEEAKVFYPGHMNPMNMSQNVIDTGTAVDTIARFAAKHRTAFSEEEHARIRTALKEVVEGYLAEAARTKQITNQRLWGLTGVASYARYVSEEDRYRTIAKESIERAFRDMTADGFFRYFPNPPRHSLPYDNMTTFYQSRHTAFIEYALSVFGDREHYANEIEKSNQALLSMYRSDGIKDLRMECKRWYWLSPYEVASHTFDAYALSHSRMPEAGAALKNVLYQVREHFYDGFLHSHKGANHNFQCPIFWTAHLAWLVRIPNIERRFNEAITLLPFSYRFEGKGVFADTNPERRILVNTLLKERNPSTGIFDNGLEDKRVFFGALPHLPHAYFFSAREAVNHAWYALRGLHVGEFIVRKWKFVIESLTMFLPMYRTAYGNIDAFEVSENEVMVTVRPGSKYGTLMKGESITVRTPL